MNTVPTIFGNLLHDGNQACESEYKRTYHNVDKSYKERSTYHQVRLLQGTLAALLLIMVLNLIAQNHVGINSAYAYKATLPDLDATSFFDTNYQQSRTGYDDL